MKKEQWLRGEIAKWRSDGAVDSATADALLARYPVNESRIGWGAVVAGAFGALLTGLGIIAIFLSRPKTSQKASRMNLTSSSRTNSNASSFEYFIFFSYSNLRQLATYIRRYGF